MGWWLEKGNNNAGVMKGKWRNRKGDPNWKE